MSEGVPKRKLFDEVQIMNTDDMQERGLANKRGKVWKVLEGDFYLIKMLDHAAEFTINGHSLRAWVEPLKGDLK